MKQVQEYGFISVCTAVHPKDTVPAETVTQKTSRAWIEISLDNLIHNVGVLKELLPADCELMAVVKANAYGHGAYRVSECLNRIGVTAFAVATVDEGITLRRKGIRGEILVLGYTDVSRVHQLIHYDLIQTVIDYDYAGRLNDCRCSVPVHIKIDTGMHRLGIADEEVDKIYEVFHYPYLKVKGIFTHLCAADSLRREDIDYTRGQIGRFYALLKALEVRGITLPKVHLQSSYGLLNYPGLRSDYARIGIALYGSLSAPEDKTRLSPGLLPVLSLKARIAMVRDIKEGEGAGYGRDFILRKNSRIAVLPIGYADGLPRSLSYGRGSVLIHGRKVPIVGRICMDQLLVDVTDLSEVEQGDIATLIGTDGNGEITAAEVADNAGSIANELFSRLGARLERIYI